MLIKEEYNMAVMIPDVNPSIIENEGERAFYTASLKLPKDYTVFYSFKYMDCEEIEGVPNVREADFVILNPYLGFLTVEVKQGEIIYENGTWYEFKNDSYEKMHKNPLEQAQSAMYAIKDMYYQKEKRRFPLNIRYGVAFPESSSIAGNLPADLHKDSIFLNNDLENLEPKIIRLFSGKSATAENHAAAVLIDKILNPKFNTIAKLEEKIERFNTCAKKVLTDEQERILDETELCRRKIFYGAAGTGKTFIAMEKAKRLADENKKVFLTCYNKNLANCEFKKLGDRVTALNFHNYIEKVLKENNYNICEPEDYSEKDKFFKIELPTLAYDYYCELEESKKFDSIVLDEGQDFRDEWIMCLENMLKEDGEFYIFADPNQNLFNCDIESIKRIDHSPLKLTRNLRNSEEINDWMKIIKPNINIKALIRGGMGVKYFSWKTPEEERKLVADEIGRLISQGINPKRITILSPHKQDKSCLAGLDKIKNWRIESIGTESRGGIKFETIRSFKGLESDVVFLIGVKKGSKVCTPEDIYVGGSRARFLLYIFHEENWSIGDVGSV